MTQTHDSDAIAAEILRLDERGRGYTEDDHHRLQEIAPALARAWLSRRVEYRPGLPSAAAIDAQRERGGWWQYKRPDHSPPQLIELRARRLPFLTDGAAPEILGNRYQSRDGYKDWRPVEGTGWKTEQNPFKKADLRADDPSEWSWRPCAADADPLPWEAGQEGSSGADLVAEVQRLRAENAELRDQLEAERLDALEAGERVP